MVSLLDVADPKNLKDILNLIDSEVSDRIPISQIMSELDTEVLNLLPTSGVMFEYVSKNISDVQNNINQTQTDLDATKNALTTKVNVSDITNIIQSNATTNKLPTDAAVVKYVEALLADLPSGGGGGIEYTAGNGIDIIDDVISIKNAVLDNIDNKISIEKITNSMLNTELTDKIPTESAVAEYINNAITDLPTGGAEYTAGTGIEITDNVIGVNSKVMLTDVYNVVPGTIEFASQKFGAPGVKIDKNGITVKSTSNLNEYISLYGNRVVFPRSEYSLTQEFNDTDNKGFNLRSTKSASNTGATQYRYTFEDLIPAEPSSKIAMRMTSSTFKPLESITILCSNEDVENDYKAGHLYRIDVDNSTTPYTHTITDITPVNGSSGSGGLAIKKYNYTTMTDLLTALNNISASSNIGTRNFVGITIANTSLPFNVIGYFKRVEYVENGESIVQLDTTQPNSSDVVYLNIRDDFKYNLTGYRLHQFERTSYTRSTSGSDYINTTTRQVIYIKSATSVYLQEDKEVFNSTTGRRTTTNTTYSIQYTKETLFASACTLVVLEED